MDTRMRIVKGETKKHKEFQFPEPMYFIVKFFNEFQRLANSLNTVESYWLKSKIKRVTIDRPIYITGLARAGTTVTLEMLSQHPDVATHKYFHMVLPYAPHFVQKIASYTPVMKSPTERLHKDGLLVTQDSPEAVEEIIWQQFFKNYQDEAITNILNYKSKNPKFEVFYPNHIKKLLINQHASRYVTKNNYNVSRVDYLHKLFPDVKFIILIRNPFNHIASLAKQDRVLRELEHENARLLDWTKIIGHREFGSAKYCINFDNSEKVQKIRGLWKQKDTYIKGWAKYWTEVYSFIHKKLQTDSSFSKASLIIRYEDLCESPKVTIDKIIGHIDLDQRKFQKVKKHYYETLHKPTYYKANFTKKEKQDIINSTREIAEKYGYVL